VQRRTIGDLKYFDHQWEGCARACDLKSLPTISLFLRITYFLVTTKEQQQWLLHIGSAIKRNAVTLRV
jgi:hypothetical protein